MSKVKVSIIITFYDDTKKLFNTINSVLGNKPAYAELIIVDNSETEKISKLRNRKDLIYIKAYKNRGFGAGNNLGAANAKGEYFFFLNPDTEINKKTVSELVKFLANHKGVGVVGPNLFDPKGNIFPQLGSDTLTPIAGMVALSFVHTVFPDNPISNKYWNVYSDKTKNCEVAVVPGSALMIKRAVFEKVKGFDENIFLFFDESDLCFRVKKAGYRVFFVANAKVTHIWKYDNRKESKLLKKYFVKSRFYYFRKHYGVFWAIIVEIFTRMSRILALFF